MGNLNENYVMTTSSGLSGFAVLVSPNHPNLNIVSEFARVWTGISDEATARNAAIASAISGEVANRNTAIGSAVGALKYFKTIGGVAATQGDDVLVYEGVGGIDLSVTGKKIQFIGTWYKDWINKMKSWRNEDVEKSVVASWMAGVPQGSVVKGKYLGEEMYNTDGWLDYWNDMLQLLANHLGWIAFSEREMCLVNSCRRYDAGLQPAMVGYNRIATVYLPYEGCMLFIKEKYESGVTNKVENVSEPILSVDMFTLYNEMIQLNRLMGARYDALEARVAALEG